MEYNRCFAPVWTPVTVQASEQRQATDSKQLKALFPIPLNTD